MNRLLTWFALLTLSVPVFAEDLVTFTGEQRVWYPLTIDVTGPELSETGQPNPFTDVRLTVTFRQTEDGQSDQVVTVPGYFAADGNAGQTGSDRGRTWRVHFVPDRPGDWNYKIAFHSGKDIVLVPPGKSVTEGKPLPGHGTSGTVTIAERDPEAPGFHARGRLEAGHGHYFRFAGDGSYFLKGGADSPENLLGYADFDGTRTTKTKGNKKGALPGGLHRYEPHVRDWKPGDPSWGNGRGKGLIGAMNYLASTGMNSVYFLTMNYTGDGSDVWPWIDPKDPRKRDRFDCSKLDQWEIVFTHMDRLGLMLHVITQETENDQLLDGGNLGRTRKLYYRELIARFGHHLAVVWNFGEENTNTTAQLKSFGKFFEEWDAADHPRVVHTYPGKQDQVYEPLLGTGAVDGASLQTNDTRKQTLRWRERSAKAGEPWVVSLDEIGPAHTGVKPDADDPRHDEVRTRHLWPHLISGGAGVEWYFGYKYAHNDLNAEDWRSRAEMWRQTDIALDFFRDHLPFTEMSPSDDQSRGDRHFAFGQETGPLCLYFPEGGTAEVRGMENCRVRWFDPVAGGKLRPGSVGTITGTGWQSIGKPSGTTRGGDWVCLIEPVPSE